MEDPSIVMVTFEEKLEQASERITIYDRVCPSE